MSMLSGAIRALSPLLTRLPSPKARLAAFVFDPRVRADPWRLYADLQQREPVLRTRFGATVLSRHRDVTAVLRDRSTSVDESRSTAFSGDDRDSAMSQLTARMMLFRDPPDHERLRRLVSRAFTSRRVTQMEDDVEELVHRCLDRLHPSGRADLVDQFAYPVPVAVICRLLGLPDRDHDRVRHLAAPLALAFDVDLFRSRAVEQAGDQAARDLTAYLRAVAATPTLRSSGGLLEELLDATADDHLGEDEAIATAALLLLAGHETTSNLVSAGIHALLGHCDEADRWRSGERSVQATAIDELLRFVSPVQFTQRVALEPMKVGGVDIESGELLALLLGAANRDPDVFDHPNRLDLGRHPNPHVAFGTGIHACLGASLARLEAQIMIPAVLRRWTNLRHDGPATWRPTFVLRGPATVPVRWN